MANGGEAIEIYVSAKNYGSVDATNVIGYLVSTSGNVLIDSTANMVEFGDIASGETINGSVPYLVVLNDGLAQGSNLDLIVNFVDNEGGNFSGILDIVAHGNSLSASNVDVLGSASDVLTPGESSYIKIELNNTGSTLSLIHISEPTRPY